MKDLREILEQALCVGLFVTITVAILNWLMYFK